MRAVGRDFVILELYDEPLLEVLGVGAEIWVTGARAHPRRPKVLRVGKGSNILKVAVQHGHWWSIGLQCGVWLTNLMRFTGWTVVLWPKMVTWQLSLG